MKLKEEDNNRNEEVTKSRKKKKSNVDVRGFSFPHHIWLSAVVVIIA